MKPYYFKTAHPPGMVVRGEYCEAPGKFVLSVLRSRHNWRWPGCAMVWCIEERFQRYQTLTKQRQRMKRERANLLALADQ